MKFNINNLITIYPSEKGWNKIIEIYYGFGSFTLTQINNELLKKKTPDGGYRDSLWCIIEELNPLFFNGSPYLLHSNVTL